LSGYGSFNAVVECPGVETDIGVRPADRYGISREIAFVVATLHTKRDDLKDRLRLANGVTDAEERQVKQATHRLSQVSSPAIKPRDESPKP
jgi:hypothetical protein